jgi:hypothetical protein
MDCCGPYRTGSNRCDSGMSSVPVKQHTSKSMGRRIRPRRGTLGKRHGWSRRRSTHLPLQHYWTEIAHCDRCYR